MLSFIKPVLKNIPSSAGDGCKADSVVEKDVREKESEEGDENPRERIKKGMWRIEEEREELRREKKEMEKERKELEEMRWKLREEKQNQKFEEMLGKEREERKKEKEELERLIVKEMEERKKEQDKNIKYLEQIQNLKEMVEKIGNNVQLYVNRHVVPSPRVREVGSSSSSPGPIPIVSLPSSISRSSSSSRSRSRGYSSRSRSRGHSSSSHSVSRMIVLRTSEVELQVSRFTTEHAWSPDRCCSAVILSNNNRTATNVANNRAWRLAVLEGQKFTRGTITVIVKINRMSSPHGCVLGVIPELPISFQNGFGYNHIIAGYGLHADAEEMGIYWNGQLLEDSKCGFAEGDVVEMTFDVHHGRLTFMVNGCKCARRVNDDDIKKGGYVACTLRDDASWTILSALYKNTN